VLDEEVRVISVGHFHLEVESLAGRKHDHPAEHAECRRRRLLTGPDQCEDRQFEPVGVIGGLFKREEEIGEIERHNGSQNRV